MNTTRTIAAVALAAALVSASAADSRGDSGRTEYLPCSTDEGPDGQRNCVWDAQHDGNGLGSSYFVGRGGKVYPLPHHIAHHLIYGG